MSIDSTQFTWDPVPELQTCTIQAFSWSYQGPALGALNISITDIDVEQQAPITSSTSSTTPATSGTSTPTTSSALATSTFSDGYRKRSGGVSLFAAQDQPLHTVHQRQGFGEYNGYSGSWLPRINQTLTLDVRAEDKAWAWSSVNVTQGWYILVANVAGDGDVLQSPSSPFFVRNGTTSCITAAAAVAPPPSSSSFTIPPSSTTSTTNGANSGMATTSSSPVFSHPGTNGAAIAGGVVGGAILVVGVLVAAAIARSRRRRSSAFTHTVNDPVTIAGLPDPYDATVEQFPIQRRTTFLPLAGSPNQYVTKVVRQPLRHCPRTEDVGRQSVEPSLPLAHAEVPQEQLNAQMEQEPAELVSVSIRASQRLPQTVDRAQSDLQHGEDGPAVDGESSTAPPGYEQVVRS